MAKLDIGVDYYYLDATDFAAFSASLSGTGFTIDDFPYFEVTQANYEGYYFIISEIDEGEMGDEWELLAQYDSFGYASVMTSVQANYMGGI